MPQRLTSIDIDGLLASGYLFLANERHQQDIRVRREKPWFPKLSVSSSITHAKDDFADVVKLKNSRWGDYLGMFNVIIRVLERSERGEKGQNRRADVIMGAEVRVMLLLGGTMSQGMWEAFRSWRRQGLDFPFKSPEETQPHEPFDFRAVKHISRL